MAHYYVNECNYTRVSKALEYVDQGWLRQWILETSLPEEQPCISK